MRDLGTAVPKWSAREHPHARALAGQYVTIRPIEPGDASGMFEAYNEDKSGDIWTYLPYGPFADFVAFEAWFNTTVFGPDPQFYVVIPHGQDRVLGQTSLLRTDVTHGSTEVGHINFSPALQRTPAATESIFLLIDHCMTQLGYRRFEWKCNNLNAPSKRAADRFGFTFEGIFRNCNVFKGHNRDTAWYSIIDSEWPAIKAGFEAWLNPDNFDGQGVQKRSLEQCRIDP